MEPSSPTSRITVMREASFWAWQKLQPHLHRGRTNNQSNLQRQVHSWPTGDGQFAAIRREAATQSPDIWAVALTIAATGSNQEARPLRSHPTRCATRLAMKSLSRREKMFAPSATPKRKSVTMFGKMKDSLLKHNHRCQKRSPRFRPQTVIHTQQSATQNVFGKRADSATSIPAPAPFTPSRRVRPARSRTPTSVRRAERTATLT